MLRVRRFICQHSCGCFAQTLPCRENLVTDLAYSILAGADLWAAIINMVMTAGAQGGAISSYHSDLWIRDSHFEKNVAFGGFGFSVGGALRFGDGLGYQNPGAKLLVERTSFVSNSVMIILDMHPSAHHPLVPAYSPVHMGAHTHMRML